MTVMYDSNSYLSLVLVCTVHVKTWSHFIVFWSFLRDHFLRSKEYWFNIAWLFPRWALWAKTTLKSTTILDNSKLRHVIFHNYAVNITKWFTRRLKLEKNHNKKEIYFTWLKTVDCNKIVAIILELFFFSNVYVSVWSEI